MPRYTMRVVKYIPEKFYGFCEDDLGHQVFFHLRNFHGISQGTETQKGEFIPPVLGEGVEVETVAPLPSQGAKAPKALTVRRLLCPHILKGRVETFDPQRGYGFIVGENGQDYHLHSSEVLNGSLPLPGDQVSFYPGLRQEKLRACHVKVCR